MQPLPQYPPHPKARKNITETQIIAALRKHAGVQALAAREVGCDRANITQRIATSPRLQQTMIDIESEIGDICEGVIFHALIGKDKQMARWYAAHKLRTRGYVTRTEMANPDGSPLAPVMPVVNINVTYVGEAPKEEDVV